MTYYDSIAPGYEQLHKEEQLAKLKLIQDNIIVKDSLLDIGCGTGFSLDMFDIKKKAGIDPSEELIKIGQKAGRNVMVGRAEKLKFEDNSFDTVISITAVQNFDNIKQGLNEIKRVAIRQVVITVLKKSSKLKSIDKLIKELFNVKKIKEQEKDMIYFC